MNRVTLDNSPNWGAVANLFADKIAETDREIETVEKFIDGEIILTQDELKEMLSKYLRLLYMSRTEQEELMESAQGQA